MDLWLMLGPQRNGNHVTSMRLAHHMAVALADRQGQLKANHMSNQKRQPKNRLGTEGAGLA